MEEVFEADGAVVPHGSHHTFMVVAERERVAAPAMLAVEEILTPSDAADACVTAAWAVVKGGESQRRSACLGNGEAGKGGWEG